jgi:hypothetical protein
LIYSFKVEESVRGVWLVASRVERGRSEGKRDVSQELASAVGYNKVSLITGSGDSIENVPRLFHDEIARIYCVWILEVATQNR